MYRFFIQEHFPKYSYNWVRFRNQEGVLIQIGLIMEP